MSEQERVSWVSLIINLVIGYWYFERVLGLPASADLFGPRTAAFALNLIIFAVFVAIASEVLLRAVQRRTQGSEGNATASDERDALIDLKASRNAYGVINVAIIIVLVQIVLIEWVQRLGRPLSTPDTVLELIATGPLAPMHIAQLLLLALTLGGITVYASRIFYYRRGH